MIESKCEQIKVTIPNVSTKILFCQNVCFEGNWVVFIEIVRSISDDFSFDNVVYWYVLEVWQSMTMHEISLCMI